MTQPPKPPITPNFNPNVGRLVTDRYDFQTHVNGTSYINANGDTISFRHQANQIDVVPTVIIGGDGYTNVQSALQAFAQIIFPVPVLPATTTAYGTIILGGDLLGIGSTAAAPIVGKIQGRPIANVSPTTGQLLTWSGSAWTPTSLTFTGDVTGTPTRTVISAIANSGSPINISVPMITVEAITAQFGGAFVTGTNGYVQIQNAGSLILFAAQDFIQYATAHTRTVWDTLSPLNFAATNWQSNGWASNGGTAWRSKDVTGSYPFIFKIDHLHNGANLVSLTVCFVTSTHTAVPQFFPTISVFRQQLQVNSNNTVNVPNTGGSPTPVDFVHYNNSGNPQSFTATFTGLNAIDTSNYVYYAVITDEFGTNSVVGNTYLGYSVSYGNILNDQFP